MVAVFIDGHQGEHAFNVQVRLPQFQRPHGEGCGSDAAVEMGHLREIGCRDEDTDGHVGRKVSGFAGPESVGTVIDVEVEYNCGKRVREGPEGGRLKKHVLWERYQSAMYASKN